MESAEERKQLLLTWLKTECGLSSLTLYPMIGDASFRRYFRVWTPSASFIAMDAPPPRENCRPFIAIANALRAQGLNTPVVFEANLEQGFLLLTDFGDLAYLSVLEDHNADLLYTRALNALATLQGCREVPGYSIPSFTREFMWQEWEWHKEWFLNKWLGLTLLGEEELDECYAHLVEMALSQPQVFMHRDYHAANLMALPHDVGILDFQDAFIGPVTYDVVSLLRDCYIDWPQAQVIQWVEYYFKELQKQGVLSQVDSGEFLYWFDMMGVQRHLKALLTFARKHVRDHQSHYLRYVPRTLNYLQQVSANYPELTLLHRHLTETVQPVVEQLSVCAP